MNFAALKNSDGSHWHRHFHEPGKSKEQLSLNFFGQAIVVTNIKRHETEKTTCFSLNKKICRKVKELLYWALRGEWGGSTTLAELWRHLPMQKSKTFVYVPGEN